MTSHSTGLCLNLSSINLTEEYWTLEGSLKIHGQVSAALFLFTILVGLPWNILVVITVLRKRLYHTPNIMLLLNMSFNDILFLMIILPVLTVTGIAGEYILGSTDMERCQTCLVTGFIPMLLLADSLFVSALMSINTFLFIYKPLRYDMIVTTRTILVAITVAAILSIALALSPLASPNTYIFFPAFQICFFSIRNNWYIVSIIIALSLAAFTIIVFTDIWIACIVQKNIKQVYASSKTSCGIDRSESFHAINERIRKERHKKQLHLFYTFVFLLLLNLITWLPQFTFIFLSAFIDIPVSILSLSKVFFLTQAAVHPIIETVLISDVREPLKKMVTCGLLKETKNLAMTEKHTCFYSIRCICAKEENHSRCSIFRLLDEALLHHNHSSSSIQMTKSSNQSGLEVMWSVN